MSGNTGHDNGGKVGEHSGLGRPGEVLRPEPTVAPPLLTHNDYQPLTMGSSGDNNNNNITEAIPLANETTKVSNMTPHIHRPSRTCVKYASISGGGVYFRPVHKIYMYIIGCLLSVCVHVPGEQCKLF